MIDCKMRGISTLFDIQKDQKKQTFFDDFHVIFYMYTEEKTTKK